MVIPGHGRVLTKDDVRAYIPKLKTMNDRMRDLVRKKVPNDQLAAQLKLDDIGWIELNEAFAAQALAVKRDMAWNTDIVNVNGGAIAIGHPIGASGALLKGHPRWTPAARRHRG